MSAPLRGANPHSAVEALLIGAIDYAGLFPPAQLDMPGAVAAYASYLDSNDRWALSRFVVPASRLEELAAAAREALDPRASSLGDDRFWRLSAVFGSDIATDMERVNAFHERHGAARSGWYARVESIELRASTVGEIGAALQVVPADFDRFVEIPLRGDVRPLVRAIGAGGAYAKVRTGGTTPDAFPSAADLTRFIGACLAEDVAFKATAGLHHPVRGEYPLTYAPDSARGTMYGFLNVFLAAAFMRHGATETEAQEILEERRVEQFAFDGRGVSWRSRRLTAEQLAGSRQRGVYSFGSCSFREPIDDLTALGLL